MTEKEIPSHHGVDDSGDDYYPNETLRLLIERSSCRSFYDREIPDDIMRQILTAGIRSPTGGNLQPYSIIRIDNRETKEKLMHLCGEQPFILTAPTNLLFCIDYRRLKRWAELEKAPFSATDSFRHFWISFQDTIIAAQNICTAADALGLGSVYVGTVMESIPEVRELLSMPGEVFPIVLLSLGYPKVRPKPKRKLGPEIIVHSEKYRDLPDEELLLAYSNKYPDLRVEITDERLETIEKICREIHSEEFSQECIERIKKQGYINPVQRYFGLHYRADYMRKGNDKFVLQTEEAGFGWFKPAPGQGGDSD